MNQPGTRNVRGYIGGKIAQGAHAHLSLVDAGIPVTLCPWIAVRQVLADNPMEAAAVPDAAGFPGCEAEANAEVWQHAKRREIERPMKRIRRKLSPEEAARSEGWEQHVEHE